VINAALDFAWIKKGPCPQLRLLQDQIVGAESIDL
jgi:hypothetical protein